MLKILKNFVEYLIYSTDLLSFLIIEASSVSLFLMKNRGFIEGNGKQSWLSGGSCGRLVMLVFGFRWNKRLKGADNHK